MIHPLAVVSPDARLSEDTVVWSGAVVEKGVKTGPGCVIGSNAYIGADSILGEAVRIQHGAFIPRSTKIGDYVFIGPNVTLTDDKYPRVNNPDYKAEPPVLGDYCSIGAGVVILPGIRIGKHGRVGAGAVVTHDVMARDLVVGVPARITNRNQGVVIQDTQESRLHR